MRKVRTRLSGHKVKAPPDAESFGELGPIAQRTMDTFLRLITCGSGIGRSEDRTSREVSFRALSVSVLSLPLGVASSSDS